MSNTKRTAALIVAAGIALAALSGCQTSATAGSGAIRTISVDDIKIPVTEANVHAAFFAPFLGNAAIQLVKTTIQKEISATKGATLDVFDANGDPTAQINQIQNAIQSAKYNVAFVIAADPTLACDAVTKQMPEAGIIVGVFNTPMCGTWKNEGDGLRAPGTFAFIGGTHTIDYYYDYFSYMAKQNPGPQKVLLITAPQLNAIAQATDIAVKRVEKENPGFQVVDEAYTDYSVSAGYTQTQAMIQAHPDATLLFSGYSTSAQGAVQALQEAGKVGSIKIYDKGGSGWAAKAVKDGLLESTTPEAQATSAKALIELLISAHDGKITKPTTILHDAIKLLPTADKKTGFEVFTKANIDSWTPEVP